MQKGGGGPGPLLHDVSLKPPQHGTMRYWSAGHGPLSVGSPASGSLVRHSDRRHTHSRRDCCHRRKPWRKMPPGWSGSRRWLCMNRRHQELLRPQRSVSRNLEGRKTSPALTAIKAIARAAPNPVAGGRACSSVGTRIDALARWVRPRPRLRPAPLQHGRCRHTR